MKLTTILALGSGVIADLMSDRTNCKSSFIVIIFGLFINLITALKSFKSFKLVNVHLENVLMFIIQQLFQRYHEHKPSSSAFDKAFL